MISRCSNLLKQHWGITRLSSKLYETHLLVPFIDVKPVLYSYLRNSALENQKKMCIHCHLHLFSKVGEIVSFCNKNSKSSRSAIPRYDLMRVNIIDILSFMLNVTACSSSYFWNNRFVIFILPIIFFVFKEKYPSQILLSVSVTRQALRESRAGENTAPVNFGQALENVLKRGVRSQWRLATVQE